MLWFVLKRFAFRYGSSLCLPPYPKFLFGGPQLVSWPPRKADGEIQTFEPLLPHAFITGPRLADRQEALVLEKIKRTYISKSRIWVPRICSFSFFYILPSPTTLFAPKVSKENAHPGTKACQGNSNTFFAFRKTSYTHKVSKEKVHQDTKTSDEIRKFYEAKKKVQGNRNKAKRGWEKGG